jgi:hypothetical protein
MVEKGEQLFSSLSVLLGVAQQNAGLAVPTVPASNIRNKVTPPPNRKAPGISGAFTPSALFI